MRRPSEGARSGRVAAAIISLHSDSVSAGAGVAVRERGSFGPQMDRNKGSPGNSDTHESTIIFVIVV